MRLLTHNLLACPATRTFPLTLAATETTVIPVAFNRPFLRHMLPRLDWAALRDAAAVVGAADGLPAEPPAVSPSPGSAAASGVAAGVNGSGDAGGLLEDMSDDEEDVSGEDGEGDDDDDEDSDEDGDNAVSGVKADDGGGVGASEGDDAAWRALHHALLEVHVLEGTLSADGRVYTISGGIPNMVVGALAAADAAADTAAGGSGGGDGGDAAAAGGGDTAMPSGGGGTAGGE